MSERFTPTFVDDTRQGTWAIIDSQVFDDAYIALGSTEEEARFGAMLLNEGGIDVPDKFGLLCEELEYALEPIECEVCGKPFHRAQIHNDRCPADLQ